MMPISHRTPSSVAPAALALALAVVLGSVAAACSSDDERGGATSARAVVDEHIRLGAEYRLVEDCELRSPERLELMAAIDGRDPEGYCDFAIGDLAATAAQEIRDEAARLYTGMTVEEVTAADGTATFDLTSADGTYVERIVAVEVDGRWFIDEATDNGGGHSHDDDHDHDGDDADEHGVEESVHAEDGGEGN